MARTTRLGRKVFNHLYEELSLFRGELFPRMELWNLVGGHYDPITLTKDQAVDFLRFYSLDPLHHTSILLGVPVKKVRRMIKRFERWDPNAVTPDEIFERICGGESRDNQTGV